MNLLVRIGLVGCCTLFGWCVAVRSVTAQVAEIKPVVPDVAQPNQVEDLAPEEEIKPLADAPPITEAAIRPEDLEHWSFMPVVRPPLPAVKAPAWPRNDVDHFILAAQEAKGLTPLPEADRVTLIRRVSFDLTGLPPSPEDIDQFLADSAPDAYERLVDRLLASKAYGERAAQHWLDLARFAETDGFEHDKVRPTAWKYRDWVIAALGSDMPFDRFVQLQLAGDELEPGNSQAAIATGFCLSGPDMPDINLQEERRHVLLNELAGTVGAVFLGLQIGCAECHDHKYDPVSQADFYRMRAIFANADIFGASKQGRVLFETSAKAKPSYLMLRGDFRRPGAEVQPQFVRVANVWKDPVLPPDAKAKTSGRRTALAKWLTRPDHPLATRVIVNRIWQQHFGFGLVRSPSDFGIMGDPPTHPELLDWLATELPRLEWRLKPLHRLLVTSATYRTASRPTNEAWTPAQSAAATTAWEAAQAKDPENHLLARMPRQRLDGEAIRDAMLLASERLSPRSGGPGIMAPLPKELLATLLKGQWQESKDEEDHRRRSIYLFVRRNLRYPLFEAFDRPDTNASCPRRGRSTVAPQALMLLNSEFALSRATDLANFVSTSASEPAAQIELAFRRTLGRRPAADELRSAEEFLAKHAKPQDAKATGGLVQFCLVLFNLNEFVTSTELVAF